MVSLINKQLLLTAYAYLFIMEQQKPQQGSQALQPQPAAPKSIIGKLTTLWCSKLDEFKKVLELTLDNKVLKTFPDILKMVEQVKSDKQSRGLLPMLHEGFTAAHGFDRPKVVTEFFELINRDFVTASQLEDFVSKKGARLQEVALQILKTWASTSKSGKNDGKNMKDKASRIQASALGFVEQLSKFLSKEKLSERLGVFVTDALIQMKKMLLDADTCRVSQSVLEFLRKLEGLSKEPEEFGLTEGTQADLRKVRTIIQMIMRMVEELRGGTSSLESQDRASPQPNAKGSYPVMLPEIGVISQSSVYTTPHCALGEAVNENSNGSIPLLGEGIPVGRCSELAWRAKNAMRGAMQAAWSRCKLLGGCEISMIVLGAAICIGVVCVAILVLPLPAFGIVASLLILFAGLPWGIMLICAALVRDDDDGC